MTFDEPPTGLIDLAAIRAAVAAAGGTPEEVNPAAVRWLAGQDDPEPVFGDIYVDDEPLPEPVEAPVIPLEVAPFPVPAPVVPVAVTPPDPPTPASPYVPTPSASERPLTWRSRHDPRSRAYGVRAQLRGSAPVQEHLWPVGPALDQGAEGQCVGFGIVDAVNAMDALDVDGGAVEAQQLFRRAQQLDGFPDTLPGTSVLAGMQAAVEAGLIGGYLWAFGTRDVAQAVLQTGPVVVGVPWLSGMYDTGPGGLVAVEGEAVGGHCLAIVGIKMKGPQGQPGPFFVWQNSWGSGYGDGGLGYIHHRDLAQLLHGTGEAAIPTAPRGG